MLSIRRYRGIEEFTWQPNAGVNCLIGPADTGKSTVLSAISLLLAPYPLGSCAEFDFYRRRLATGFEIEAYIGALDLAQLGAAQRAPILHGWANGAPQPLPENGAEPVLRCRVRGTPDLELVYELPVDGLDTLPPFTPALRRTLLLGRLAGEDRAARDLRLGTGSLLDRHLRTSDMRGPVHTAIADASQELELPEATQQGLEAIRGLFRTAGLPTNLHLSLVPNLGNSLVGMIALASGDTAAEAVPLTHAGTGTRQLALLSLSAALVGSAPILVIDEPERGLEPYRQRATLQKVVELAGADGQAFITTHSPAVLGSVPANGVWRVRAGQSPVPFIGDPLTRLLKNDPEAFLSPAPILCEGVTEVGLLDVWLPGLCGDPGKLSQVKLIDGQGQPNVLTVAEAFVEAGLRFGLFVDSEDQYTGRRANLRNSCAAFIWDGYRNPEEAACRLIPHQHLFALLDAAAEANEVAVRYFEDQVFERIAPDRRIDGPRQMRDAGYAEELLREAILAAMTENTWFKRRAGGQTLARTINRIGMPAEIQRQLNAFGAQLRAVMGWDGAGGRAAGAAVQ
jgi:putative ATP-dependent endonuclease of OLD family